MIVTEYELLVCLAEELNMRKSAEKLFFKSTSLIATLTND